MKKLLEQHNKVRMVFHKMVENIFNRDIDGTNNISKLPTSLV